MLIICGDKVRKKSLLMRSSSKEKYHLQIGQANDLKADLHQDLSGGFKYMVGALMMEPFHERSPKFRIT